MVDISSRGAAFTCYSDQERPHLGQHITARFSVPKYGPNKSFDMADFVRSGHVCRVESSNGYLYRIAVQFAEPLIKVVSGSDEPVSAAFSNCCWPAPA